jgi:4'-phosphopantetheinyl transferase
MTVGLPAAAPIDTAPAPARLGGDDVHVWSRRLDDGAVATAELLTVLSGDERARAERFHFERDRVRFIVARASLRQILGAYLDTAPARLAFAYGPQGKPALAWPPAFVTFNLSHSGELVLYALARARRVGIDVERRRPVEDVEGLAATVFAAAERAELASLPADQRIEAFLDGWTRKEAFIKAVGEGLSHPLDTFVVSLAPAAPARLVCVGDRPGAACGWSLHALTTEPGYTASLAVEGDVASPTCGTWGA